MRANIIWGLLLIVLVSPHLGRAASFDVQPLWSRNFEGRIDSLELRGRHILVSYDGDSIALITSTGRLLWMKKFETGVTATALGDEYLAVSFANGELSVLDYQGVRVLNRVLGGYVGYDDALFVSSKGVYAGDMGGVVSFIPFNGVVGFNVSADAYIMHVGGLGERVVFASDKGLYSIEGGAVANILMVQGFIRSVHIQKDYVSIASDEGILFYLDDASDYRWSMPVGDTVGAIFSSKQGAVAGSLEERIHVYDSGGALEWNTSVDGSVARVFRDGDFVVASTLKNRVYVFNWRGRLLWANIEETSISSLVLGDETLVYASEGGEIKFFVLSPKTSSQLYLIVFLMGLTVFTGFLFMARSLRTRPGEIR